ncbi:hypothetical protein RB201_23595 [Streptomyces sp. S1A(2023)]
MCCRLELTASELVRVEGHPLPVQQAPLLHPEFQPGLVRLGRLLHQSHHLQEPRCGQRQPVGRGGSGDRRLDGGVEVDVQRAPEHDGEGQQTLGCVQGEKLADGVAQGHPHHMGGLDLPAVQDGQRVGGQFVEAVRSACEDALRGAAGVPVVVPGSRSAPPPRAVRRTRRARTRR